MSGFAAIAFVLFGALVSKGQADGECPGQCLNFIGDLEKEIEAVCGGGTSKLVSDVAYLMRKTDKLAESMRELELADENLTAVDQNLTAGYKRLQEEDLRLEAVDYNITEIEFMRFCEELEESIRKLELADQNLTAVDQNLTAEFESLAAENERLTEEDARLAAEDLRLAGVDQNLTAEDQRLAAEDLRLDGVDQVLLNATAALAGRGASYTRWGRKVCSDSSELLYTGYAAGGYFGQASGANYVCLPETPQNSVTDPGVQACRSYMYGGEYKTCDTEIFGTGNAGAALSLLANQNVPCAVCHAAPRLSHVFIPAKTECPAEWTKEYQGFIVAAKYDSSHRSQWVCMDADPETFLPAGGALEDGALFYVAEVVCGFLPCPPYIEGDELSCVVCTK